MGKFICALFESDFPPKKILYILFLSLTHADCSDVDYNLLVCKYHSGIICRAQYTDRCFRIIYWYIFSLYLVFGLLFVPNYIWFYISFFLFSW